MDKAKFVVKSLEAYIASHPNAFNKTKNEAELWGAYASLYLWMGRDAKDPSTKELFFKKGLQVLNEDEDVFQEYRRRHFYTLKMHLHAELGEEGEAQKAAEGVLEMDPPERSLGTYLNAQALHFLGRYQEAVDLIRKYLKDSVPVQADLKLYILLGECLLEVDKPVAAYLMFYRCIDQNPIAPLVYAKILSVLLRYRDHPVAREELLFLFRNFVATAGEETLKKRFKDFRAKTKVVEFKNAVVTDSDPFESFFSQILPLAVSDKELFQELVKELLLGADLPVQIFETTLQQEDIDLAQMQEAISQIQIEAPPRPKRGKKASAKVREKLREYETFMERKARLEEIIPERLRAIEDRRRREEEDARRSAEEEGAKRREEEVREKKEWLASIFKGFDSVLLGRIAQRISFALDKGPFLAQAREVLDQIAQEDYPYIPKEERRATLAEAIEGKSTYHDLAQQEIERFTPHWPNIADLIPNLIVDAKEVKRRMVGLDTEVVANERNEGDTQVIYRETTLYETRSFYVNELISKITIVSIEREIETHSGTVGALFRANPLLRDIVSIRYLDDVSQLILEKLVLFRGLEKDPEKALTYPLIQSFFWAEVFYWVYRNKFKFMIKENLLRREDCVQLLGTKEGGEPQFEDILEKIHALLVKRFRARFPFYAGDFPDNVILKGLFKDEYEKTVHYFAGYEPPALRRFRRRRGKSLEEQLGSQLQQLVAEARGSTEKVRVQVAVAQREGSKPQEYKPSYFHVTPFWNQDRQRLFLLTRFDSPSAKAAILSVAYGTAEEVLHKLIQLGPTYEEVDLLRHVQDCNALKLYLVRRAGLNALSRKGNHGLYLIYSNPQGFFQIDLRKIRLERGISPIEATSLFRGDRASLQDIRLLLDTNNAQPVAATHSPQTHPIPFAAFLGTHPSPANLIPPLPFDHSL